MGVALNADQMKQLLRYTESKNVILNFDADKAGITAAEKAITGFKELVFNGTVQLRVLTMPNGKDADEYLKQHNAEAYRDLLKNAPLFLDWQIDQILAGQNLNQADNFQKSSQAIAQLLNNLPVDSFFRSHSLKAPLGAIICIFCEGAIIGGDLVICILNLEKNLYYKKNLKGIAEQTLSNFS